jgi:hypothetical protein
VVEERSVRAARDEETLARRKVRDVLLQGRREIGSMTSEEGKAEGDWPWFAMAHTGGERSLLTDGSMCDDACSQGEVEEREKEMRGREAAVLRRTQELQVCVVLLDVKV